MILSYLGQVPAQWFSESGDAALAGGVLRFYSVGTTTPKEVFRDYQGLTSAGSSVTLDASGRANIFWSGLFKVTLEDADGNLIGNAIDGVGSGALGAGGSVVYVGNYGDVRALGGGGESIVVFVEGREANGDGGAGVFVWDALETAADDGGTILAPSSSPVSGRYVRIFEGSMDLRWWATPDGTTALDTAFATARAAALARGIPLRIRGGIVRISQLTTISAGVMIEADEGAGITASSAIPLVFSEGSRFVGAVDCLHGSVVPTFNAGTVDAVDPDWFSDTSDATKLARASAACVDGMRVRIARKIAHSGNLNQGAYAILSFEGAGCIAFAADTTVTTIRRWIGDSTVPRFTWPSWDAVQACTITFENPTAPVSIEAVGAIGDGNTDDSIALYAATRCALGAKVGGKTYRIARKIEGDNVRISGDLQSALGGDSTGYKLLFSPIGGLYRLDPTDETTVTRMEIPDLDTSRIVAACYSGTSYYVATSPGYIYRLDVDGSEYAAVKLTDTARKFVALLPRTGGVYAVVYDSTVQVYTVAISGNVGTETLSATSTATARVSGAAIVGSSLWVAKYNTVVSFDLSTWAETTVYTLGAGSLTGLSTDGTIGYFSAIASSVNKAYSLTSGGTATEIGTIGHDVAGIAYFGGDLYLPRLNGNISKMTLAGVVTTFTTGSSRFWASIQGGNAELLIIDSTIETVQVSNITRLRFAIRADDGGSCFLNSISLDGGNLNIASDYVAIENIHAENLGILATNFRSTRSSCASTVVIGATNESYSGHRDGDGLVGYGPNTKLVGCENHSSTYSAFVVTDEDGVPSVTNTPLIESLTASAIGFETPKDMGDGDYTVLDSDPIILYMTPTVDRTVTLLAAAGVTRPMRYIVCNYQTAGAQIFMAGDLANLGGVNPVVPPDPNYHFRYLLTCIFIPALGKWSVG